MFELITFALVAFATIVLLIIYRTRREATTAVAATTTTTTTAGTPPATTTTTATTAPATTTATTQTNDWFMSAIVGVVAIAVIAIMLYVMYGTKADVAEIKTGMVGLNQKVDNISTAVGTMNNNIVAMNNNMEKGFAATEKGINGLSGRVSKLETTINNATDSNKTWLSRFTNAFLDGWHNSAVIVLQDTTSRTGLQKIEKIAAWRDSVNNAKTDSLIRSNGRTNDELARIKTTVNNFPGFDVDTSGALQITVSTRVDTVTHVKRFKFNNNVGTAERDTN